MTGSAGKPVPRGCRRLFKSLRKLQPFFDEDGIIRVGGRLQYSDLSVDQKHPILLPKRHEFVRLLAVYTHWKLKHSGYTNVLAKIREKFWIINGQSAVRFYLKNCMVCKKHYAKPGCQQMAPLPRERLTGGNRVFAITGVDFFGPEYVVVGRKKLKRYGCLFTCLTTRAVHIEVTHSLSTDSFILALLRFIYARGSPVKQLISDNATNFKGAENELKACVEALKVKAESDRIKSTLFDEDVLFSWKHTSPLAPHQGGAWERLVGQTKRLLHAVYQKESNRYLDDEEFLTYTKEIENILNWRPLTPLSDDPDDFSCISPMSLLNAGLDPSLPLGSFVKSDGLRKSWKRSQYLADQFWICWKKFYLPLLQPRGKWHDTSKNVAIGDLVLIRDADVARNKWPLARVTEVFPGRDGLVRKIKVMTSDRRTYQRDVRGVCHLESNVF